MIYIKYTENERFSNTNHTKNHRKLCPQKKQKLSSLNTILVITYSTLSKFCDGKLAQRKLCQSYLLVVNSKTNKWLNQILIPKRCFDWSIPIKVRQSFSQKNRMGFYFLKVGQSPSKFFDKVFDAGLHIKELCQWKL